MSTLGGVVGDLTRAANGRCLVMGVLNVTPDSFSDGGLWLDADAAIEHGLALVAQGADLVDVGGESTRPGALRVDPVEEQRRIVPVIRALAAAGVAVSVDTMHAHTATAALLAGAALVNDVSGGLADPDLLRVAADADVPYVVMHWRGHSDAMASHAHYDDVVAEVCEELLRRVDAVLAAGVRPEQVVLDPGLGFAKDAGHNWSLIAALDELCGLGYPLLLGASRKRFLGTLLGQPREVELREDATVAVTALAGVAGVWCVRVHVPRANRDAAEVARAVARARRTDAVRSSEPDAEGDQ